MAKIKRISDGKLFYRYFYSGDNVGVNRPPVYWNRPSWYIAADGEELRLDTIDTGIFEVTE